MYQIQLTYSCILLTFNNVQSSLKFLQTRKGRDVKFHSKQLSVQAEEIVDRSGIERLFTVTNVQSFTFLYISEIFEEDEQVSAL